MLAGFENHGGRTHLGAGEQPLGRVCAGTATTGADGFEGVLRGAVIGTYLHGPLLPKNAWFADWLIRPALGSTLAPLDDALEDAAHAAARRAAGVDSSGSASGPWIRSRRPARGLPERVDLELRQRDRHDDELRDPVPRARPRTSRRDRC